MAETDDIKNCNETEDNPIDDNELLPSPLKGKIEPARGFEMSSSPWKSEIITHLRTFHNRLLFSFQK